MSCSSCSGGCTSDKSTSSGCSCSGGCTGCNSSCNGCSGSCDGCSGGCSGCSGSCDGGCSTGCNTGCNGTCKGICTSCIGTCTGTCTNICTGCTGTCTGACTGSCTGYCDNACTSASASEVIASLGGNIDIGNIIKGSEVQNLQNNAYNELARRSLNPVVNNELFDIVRANYSNKLFNDIRRLNASTGINANNIVFASNYKEAKTILQLKMAENLKN